MIAIKESTNLQGELHMKIMRGGTLYHVERMKNLIVLQGRYNMAQMLGGATGLHITHIGIGEGSGPVASTDTQLVNPLLLDITERRIGSGLLTEEGDTFDDDRIIQFHFRIGKSEAIGKPIWEYGLFAADGTMFSRLVRGREFIKDGTDRIEGWWQVQF